MTDDPLNRLRFRPPYVGQRGWLGVWLDVPVDWDEVRAIVADAHQLGRLGPADAIYGMRTGLKFVPR